jgi:YegS/Rv2252/BmrU family lipid kinase
MRKAALFYNPLSGRRRDRRLADVQSACEVLERAGIEVSLAATLGRVETVAQVNEAVAQGYDAVFACGGDGTIHDVLQGVVGTGAVLGIIPLGTANALAHDLGLPLSPRAAAEASLAAVPRCITVGVIRYTDFDGQAAQRYFTVAAGIGVDAHLFYQLNPQVKSRLGMAAYYAKATRLWLTHPLEKFAVEVAGAPPVEVSQLLAVRIRFFGGVLRELAPGASLDRDDLRLVFFKTRSRIAYLRYILRGLFGQVWAIRGIELSHGRQLKCWPLGGSLRRDSRVFVEADGELLGTLPAEIGMLPDALNLLAPKRK